ncbi:MAG: ATP phosphoribosyltransferase [Clostridiales bacterium]|jgi:ATP phosphoribosyltransferase|nr:ATP phosphoribosyltransferase [Clostridiales bacterium]
MITFALPKGRLAEKTLKLLARYAGIELTLQPDDRRLWLDDPSGRIRFLLVKPADVPVYVERGAAALGVAGKDTLIEEGRDVYEMLDLKFGACRLCVAGFTDRRGGVTNHNLRVATKYVNAARSYYAAKGVEVDIIKLNGSVELAPVIDLSDVIFDIVESGKTLQENNLTVLDEVVDVSARLIVNKVHLKTNAAEILPLLDALRAGLEKEKA